MQAQNTNLSNIIDAAQGLGVSIGLLPEATTRQPSQLTGSPSNTAPPTGMVVTGGAAPANPPPSVPSWVWIAGGGLALVIVIAALSRR